MTNCVEIRVQRIQSAARRKTKVKYRMSLDNAIFGTEKAERLGEFNDMLLGARLPKVQKAWIKT